MAQQPRRRLRLAVVGTAAVIAAFVPAGAALAASADGVISTSSSGTISDGTILGYPAQPAASGSLKETVFVCPSVSTQNSTADG